MKPDSIKRNTKSITEPNILGNAQSALESAAKKLSVTQTAYQKAISDYQAAEDVHAAAMVAMADAFNKVRESCKVPAIGSK